MSQFLDQINSSTPVLNSTDCVLLNSCQTDVKHNGDIENVIPNCCISSTDENVDNQDLDSSSRSSLESSKKSGIFWFISSIFKSDLFIPSFGLLLAFISGVLMTAYSSMLKMVHDMDPMQVLVIRGVLQLIIYGSIAKYKKSSFRGSPRLKISFFLFLLAFTGGLRLLFIFTSFSRLNIGDSTTILFSSPILVMVLSIFLLSERCGMFRMVAVSTMITGVVLIAKPPIVFGSAGETYDAIGYTLALSACVMSALGVVLTKLVSKDVDKPVVLFYLGVASSSCGTIGLLTLGEPSVGSYHDWIVGVAIGLLGLLQQYLLVWAIQLESPARVTIMRQMQIVLAYIVEIVLFGVVPTWSDLLGAGLVLCTVIAMSFEKTLLEKCTLRNLRIVTDEEAARPLIPGKVTQYGTNSGATVG